MKKKVLIVVIFCLLGFAGISVAQDFVYGESSTGDDGSVEEMKNNKIYVKDSIFGIINYISGDISSVYVNYGYKHKFNFGLGLEISGNMLGSSILMGDVIVSYYPFKNKFPIYVGYGIPVSYWFTESEYNGLHIISELSYFDVGFDFFPNSLISLTLDISTFTDPEISQFLPFLPYVSICINF